MPHLRAVSPETLPLLEQGLRALALDLGDPFAATQDTLARALFSATPSCHGIIAERDGAVGGITLFSPLFSTMVGQAGVYVSDLWVSSATRGTGLGHRLLAETARQGRMLWDATFLRLISYDDNPRAGAFYSKLGFEPHHGETTLRLTGAAFDKLARSK